MNFHYYSPIRKKKIQCFNNNNKIIKKRYHEEIFMPKFFLNLLNLSKKAESSGRNSLNILNQELFLNSKTSFDNIPSINIRNIKAENNNKKEKSNKIKFDKINYMSSLNSPGRVIIRPSLPIIDYKANTIYCYNNDSTIKNSKEKYKVDNNKNLYIKIFPRKNLPSSINKKNSCSCNIINLNKNVDKRIKNLSFPKNMKLSYINNDSCKKINIKIDEQWNFNKLNINKNNISINNFIDLQINNKFKHFYTKKTIINKKTIKENSKENIRHIPNINNLSLIKESIIKTIPKKILLNLIRITDFPIHFRNKDEISYLFLNKKIINFAINSNIILNKQNQHHNYYYYINKMYRNQINDYMRHRINWKYVDYNIINKIKNNNDEQVNINFEWKYYSNRLNYKNYKYESYIPLHKLRMVNLFERNFEIGNKKNMFLNLISYCDKIKYNIFEIVPFTLIISYKKNLIISMKSLKELIEFIEKNKNKNSDIITNTRYNEYFWYDKNYEKISNQIIYINKNYISEKNYWIIKPTDLYQGKYIEICNTYDDIYKICINMFKGINDSLIKEDEDDNQNNNNNTNKIKNIIKKTLYHKMYYCNDIIIQKYLDNPLLYKKRKFDIRCFALLDYNLNLFYCREGHLKGSSELYNVHNSNKFIHITNYSFQKKSSKFEKYEEGNEISFKDFKLFLEEEKIPLEKFNLMIEQIKFLIKVSFKSVNKKLYKINNVLCFELFGYDFIIDNDFKPWILEINNNPGLGISSPVIKNIIPRMMDDAFRLTIDKVFETKYSENCIDANGNYKSRFPIEGYKDDENIFEFLCNIK